MGTSRRSGDAVRRPQRRRGRRRSGDAAAERPLIGPDVSQSAASSPTAIFSIPVEGITPGPARPRHFADTPRRPRRTRRSTSWRQGIPPWWPSRTAPLPGCSYSRAGGITVYQFDPTERFLLLLRPPRPVCGGADAKATGSEGAGDRLCRHFGQCPEKHAASALCDFPAVRRETLVGRHPDRPLRRPAVAFQPFGPPPVQAGAGEELASGHCDAGDGADARRSGRRPSAGEYLAAV